MRITFLALMLAASPAMACLWDYDTLAMERRRFPDTLEIITGKFLHHSKAFYEWRIEDREARLKASPDDLRLLDDLAVAYDKVGRTKAGIEVLRRSEKLAPNRYETNANLGTLLIHDRQLEAGLRYIKRAIEINPDAHFGREVYQQRLVEYVLEVQRELGSLRLPMTPLGGTGFETFLAKQGPPFGEAEWIRAIKGVQGMLVFGHNDSPVLLEALGDLLAGHHSRDKDAKRLAARAYLRASYGVKDPKAATEYRQRAEHAAKRHEGLSLAQLEDTFKAELAEAEAWRAELAANEARWIREGLDPEAEYAKAYPESPQLEASSSWLDGLDWLLPNNPAGRLMLGLLFGWILAPVLAIRLWRRLRRGRRRAPKPGGSAPDRHKTPDS